MWAARRAFRLRGASRSTSFTPSAASNLVSGGRTWRIAAPLCRLQACRDFAIKQFPLSDIGEGIAEVKITEWHVKEGDVIDEMDELCVVESDKASVDITSRYAGKIVKIHYQLDEVAKIGSVLVDIECDDDAESDGEGASAEEAKTDAPAPSASTPAQTTSGGGGAVSGGVVNEKVLATPAVRALAREMGVDLSTIAGSGRDGRVMKEDVRSPKPAGGATPAEVPVTTSHTPKILEHDQIIKLNGIQIAMVREMTRFNPPTFGVSEEIDLTNIVPIVKVLKEACMQEHGVNLTLTSFFIKNMSMCLTEFPQLNSKLLPSETEVVMHADHNMSFAIDTPNGLMVRLFKKKNHCGF